MVFVRQYWELPGLVPDSASQMSVQRYERVLGVTVLGPDHRSTTSYVATAGGGGASVSPTLKCIFLVLGLLGTGSLDFTFSDTSSL